MVVKRLSVVSGLSYFTVNKSHVMLDVKLDLEMRGKFDVKIYKYTVNVKRMGAVSFVTEIILNLTLDLDV
jgi:hypothetical protein